MEGLYTKTVEPTVTTSSLTMEVEAIKHEIQWLASQASTAHITSGLQPGRADVLRGLRNFLNMDRPEHHRFDRPKERGAEKGSGQHSILQGWERSVFNRQTLALFQGQLEETAERHGGVHMGLSQPYDAILS